MGRKENFIKKWGMTPTEFKKRKKQRKAMAKEFNLIEPEGTEIDDTTEEDLSHCDMVEENY